MNNKRSLKALYPFFISLVLFVSVIVFMYEPVEEFEDTISSFRCEVKYISVGKSNGIKRNFCKINTEKGHAIIVKPLNNYYESGKVIKVKKNLNIFTKSYKYELVVEN